MYVVEKTGCYRPGLCEEEEEEEAGIGRGRERSKRSWRKESRVGGKKVENEERKKEGVLKRKKKNNERRNRAKEGSKVEVEGEIEQKKE